MALTAAFVNRAEKVCAPLPVGQDAEFLPDRHRRSILLKKVWGPLCNDCCMNE